MDTFVGHAKNNKYHLTGVSPSVCCLNGPWPALLNCERNNAYNRTKDDFVRRFGQNIWDAEMQPIMDEGILLILRHDVTDLTLYFVQTLQKYVFPEVFEDTDSI